MRLYQAGDCSSQLQERLISYFCQKSLAQASDTFGAHDLSKLAINYIIETDAYNHSHTCIDHRAEISGYLVIRCHAGGRAL